MKHIELESELRARIKRRRRIFVILCLIFLAAAIVFTVAYEQSKTVKTIDLGPMDYEIVTYNNDLAFGILIGWIGVIYPAVCLLFDYIRSRIVTVRVNEDHITFYRGLSHNNLYVNGEYKDGLSLFGYYLEAPLSDGSKVSVALGRWSAHMTFSNGHPSINI